METEIENPKPNIKNKINTNKKKHTSPELKPSVELISGLETK
jgi:hypothetical protein